MPSQFRQVALIGKYNAPGLLPALQGIVQFLLAQGCQVMLDEATARSTGLTPSPSPQLQIADVATMGARCDLGLVVGGDGTMLGIARQLAPFDVPLIGINQGRLGFITDIAFDNYQATLAPMLAGQYEEDSRQMMQAQVERAGSCVFAANAMNDVVVHRGATAGMVELRVHVDGHFVAQQRADGLILASPTGATAYALSAGGPLLHPSIGAWVLVPIAPHTLSNRPLVLASNGTVAIEIVSSDQASANFDMQSLASLQPGDRIVVTRSVHQTRFLHPKGWSYFDTLREKMHWNEDGV